MENRKNNSPAQQNSHQQHDFTYRDLYGQGPRDRSGRFADDLNDFDDLNQRYHDPNNREDRNYYGYARLPEERQNGNPVRGNSSPDPYAVSQRDSQPNHYGKGPKNYKRTDERIREEICEILFHHNDIDASEIEVSVKDGLVTLTGNVNDRQTKRLVEDVVEACNGVTNVRNLLQGGRS